MLTSVVGSPVIVDTSATTAVARMAWLGLVCILAAASTGLVVRHRVRRRKWAVVAETRRSGSGPAEASMNLDRADVRTFLQRLVARVPVLNALSIDQCVAQIATMERNAELEWRFDSMQREGPISVSVRAVGSDVDAVDLYFFSTPEVVSLIQQEMRAWVG